MPKMKAKPHHQKNKALFTEEQIRTAYDYGKNDAWLSSFEEWLEKQKKGKQ